MKKVFLVSLISCLFICLNCNKITAQCLFPAEFSWYVDADGDNEGNLNKPVENSCSYCTGLAAAYVANGNTGPRCVQDTRDCDDSNPNINSKTVFYLDSDGDGYYRATWKREDQCVNCGAEALKLYECRTGEWVAEAQKRSFYYGSVFYGSKRWQWELKGPGDCDDSNPYINPETVWYFDIDRDGFFTASQKGCSKPAAGWFHIGEPVNNKPYVAFVLGDCNDNDANIYQERTLYPDKDGDTYRSEGAGVRRCVSVAPAGFTDQFKEIDCDDNNFSVYRTGTFYKDDDKDFYLIGPYTLCYGDQTPAGYLPDGSRSRGEDCDDKDYLSKGKMPALVDADYDGFAGSLTPVNACFSGFGEDIYFAPGYIKISENKGLDCDDNNSLYNQSRMYYKDADRDGYPALGFDSVSSCSPPAGYSTIELFKVVLKAYGAKVFDCNDNDPNSFDSYTIYLDADGDGVPKSNMLFCSGGEPPVGYTTRIHPSVIRSNLIDVNDNNPAVYYTEKIYDDKDGDKWPKDLNQPIVIEVGDGWTTPVGKVHPRDGMWNQNDCDDNNANVKGGSGYYVDNDRDGVGSSIYTIICPAVSFAPAGYSSSTGDCDDNNAGVKSWQTWYFDADNDGSPSDKTIYGGGCERPVGAKKASELTDPNSFDCNDNNAAIFPNNTWYQDLDNDGYSSGITAIFRVGCSFAGYKRAGELIAISGDCNDNNAAFNPGAATAVWYRDADGDGFGNPSVSLTQCPAPSGYVANNTDCDDSNNKINPNSVWFKDSDNDNLTDGTVLYQCARPTNYKLSSELIQGASGDCDDNSASISSACVSPSLADVNGNFNTTIWLRDDDGDGYSPYSPVVFDANNRTVGYQCAPNCNWVCAQGCTGTSKRYKGRDCNDQDPNINTAVSYYIDADGDGYASSLTTFCSLTPPSTYKTAAQIQNGWDCDDNNVNIKSGAISGNLYYRDADGDGFGNPNLSIKDCSIPSGYVTNNTDCNDVLATVNPNTIWYKDADNDGYTDSVSSIGCIALSGYKLITALASTAKDCNDAVGAINPATNWYKDADNDLVSDGTKLKQCSRPVNYKLTTELSDTISDCNDNNASIKDPYIWYKDADNDNHGDGISLKGCSKPVNYKSSDDLISLSGDCDDNNASIKPGSSVGVITWYQDIDKDGFGNPNVSISYCKQPVGYVNDNRDCNDNDPDSNPTTKWFKDSDGDGYSDGSAFLTQCEKPAGYVNAARLVTSTDTINVEVPSTNGLALSLDGQDDYLEVGNVSNLTDNLTIEAWFKWNGLTSASIKEQIIVYNGFANGYGIALSAAGKIGIILGSVGQYDGSITAPVNQWTHVALTRNAGTWTLYVNGQASLTNNVNISALSSSYLMVGTGFNIYPNLVNLGARFHFNGAVDEIRFWNTPRTVTQINASKDKELMGNEPNLIAYYNFNQGTAGGVNTSITKVINKTSSQHYLNFTNVARTGANSNFINPGGVSTTVKTTRTYVDTVNVTIVSTTGQALNFNQSGSNYVNIPDVNNSLDIQNEFTIEAWINPSDALNNSIVDKGDYKYLFSHNPNNTSGMGIYRNLVWIYNPMTIPLNTWTHVALSYSVSQNQVKFFQNGVQVGPTYTGAVSLTSDNGPVNIGRQSPLTCACNTFNGSMDEVRLWNKVRTPQEILANYTKEINGVTSGLVGNYHFNQGLPGGNNTAITSLIDDSGNNNQGTLVNFTKNGATSNFISPGGINNSYQTFGGDCNDSDPNQYKDQLWYKDADNDLISDGANYIGCKDSVGFKPAYALKSLIGDCDDNDATEKPNTLWLKDADNDKFTDGTAITQCTRPVGFKTVDEVNKIDSIVGTTTTVTNALNFDGINDHLSSSAPLITGTDNYSFEIWSKWDGGNNQLIFVNGHSQGVAVLINSSGKYAFSFMGVADYPSNVSPELGKWTHIAFTKGNGTSTLYINGVIATSTLVNHLVPNTATYLGAYQKTLLYFKGSLEDFKVWNRSLSASEIVANMNKQLIGTESNLVNYYNFNQGIAGGDNTTVASILDKTSNNRALTMNGFAKTGATSNFVAGNSYTTTGKIPTNLDCDDNNATLRPNQVWYKDIDGDTLGNPSIDSISCTKPVGYVLNNLDNNDSTISKGFPRLEVRGNRRIIANKDITTSDLDNTSFGVLCQKSPNVIKSFQIKNIGTDTLKLRFTNLVQNKSAFTILDTLANLIKPKDSIQVNVALKTDTAGSYEASFYLVSNDAANPIYLFDIGGEVLRSDSTFISDTICAGSKYKFNNIDYTSTGRYFAKKLNKLGCDSTIVLNLFVKDASFKTTLSGSVSSNNILVSTGEVYLYQIKDSVISTLDTSLISNGMYSFSKLEPGSYKLKYSCGKNCGVVPTYFESTYQYQLSKNITLNGCPQLKINNINVKAIAIKALSPGTGSVIGNVKNGVIANAKVNANFEGIDLFLINANKEIVGYTTTDENGTFSFTSLPTGDYKIIADLVGYKSDTTKIFTIGTLNSNLTESFCIDEKKKSIGICEKVTDLKPQILENLSLVIYPNPSEGRFIVNLSLKDVEVKVFNNLGVVLLSEKIAGNTTEIDLSNKPSGVYILQIISNKGIIERALLKY